MVQIHPTAVVSARAELADDVVVGPFVVIEDGVQIESGCHLAARVVLKTGTRLGRDNVVGEGAVLGGRPQHLRCDGSTGRLTIGQGNQIRENVTIHCGLRSGDETRLGDANLLMVNSHVAHDCVLGSQIVVVNNVLLAGHVTVGDRAYLAGASAVHQFCRIGRLAMVGGQARITQDVPPFVTVDGMSGRVVGLNLIGLRRAGFDTATIEQLKAAYRLLYRTGLSWDDALTRLRAGFPEGVGAEFAEFLARTQRGVVRQRRHPRLATVPFPTAAESADFAAARRAG